MLTYADKQPHRPNDRVTIGPIRGLIGSCAKVQYLLSDTKSYRYRSRKATVLTSGGHDIVWQQQHYSVKLYY